MLKESQKGRIFTSGSSAEHIHELQKTIEQERQAHRDQIESLRSQLERRTNEMHETESTLKRKLAETEATAAETKEKYREYAAGICKGAKERQNFLKEEITFFRRKTNQHLVTIHQTYKELAWEKNRASRLRRTLERVERVSPGVCCASPRPSHVPGFQGDVPHFLVYPNRNIRDTGYPKWDCWLPN
ncbi:hypothetical protein COCON_G00231480 [Conger conger]|uniref:Uncharacterized protein n=1 Tax=Conger conger TaxID=82655 RepID=A0A9Q1HMA1_CONCO|nr:hypothetical protein COCON_G00231480 [Conger conger]